MMKYFLHIIISSFLFFAAAIAAAEDISPTQENSANDKDFTNAVKLRALNKITARASSMEISLNQITGFGNLEILLESCWRSPPEEEPESKAMLKIWEHIPGEDQKEIFHGWMFSSSPAISALEHPVYDITVIECKNSGEKHDS